MELNTIEQKNKKTAMDGTRIYSLPPGKKSLNSGVRYFFFPYYVKLDEKQQSSIEVVSSCVSRKLYVLKKW